MTTNTSNNNSLISVKELFFDRQKILASVDVATRTVLSKFGAFVRRTAKGSIKTKKGQSPPGTPPHSHSGLLKKFIFFSYDRMLRSVVVGPTLLPNKGVAKRLTGPEVLEYGGQTTRSFWNAAEKKRQTKHVTVGKRPYMHPAYEKESLQLPAMWRDSVK